jgi:PAS domain S-box-containing protein
MVGIPFLAIPGFRLADIDPIRLTLLILTSLLVSAVAHAQRRMRQILRNANEDLDKRVQSRTQDLARAVEKLESEVEQRKRTEEALLESEERVDFALDAAGIGRWDLDLATQKMTRSLRHDQIFGYDTLVPDWTHKTVLEHIIPDLPDAIAEFQAALDGKVDYNSEFRILRRDGEARWILARGKIRRDDAGNPVSMLGSIGDITASKTAEQRLETQLERLNLLDQITRVIGERQDLRSIFQVLIRSLEDNCR